ncbi:MAG TPA: TadE family protein [Bryobacteraceae bacterium]|nr:TadE family protein [Bryobacteraceae bacterium]
MTDRRSRTQRGNATVEFALVFLPLTLLMLGVVEVARIGWLHQTLTMSVKTLARQAIVRGEKCMESSPGCTKTIANWVQSISSSAIGMESGKMSLTFTTQGTSKSCVPVTSCQGDGSVWPPAEENAVGLPIAIRGSYEMAPFFWLIGDRPNGRWTLTVSSREVIQF